MLDNKVYPNPKVQEFLSTSYVSVKLDADAPIAKMLLRQYGMRGIPALLVFGSDGALRGKASGAPGDAESFIQFVTQLSNGMSR